ncbi:MAG: DUF1446 domain-containing protein [Candidatus Wallbacteria bacterium]|nr:DUF1446 domain-containing protein [Candidatus Wallbacteria bacterium]
MIRIANAGGYWGDDLGAIERQLRGGPVDYVTIDFLAEITMSIMQKQRARDPKAGYARDFVEVVAPLLPLIAERGIKLVTNAGGVNPRGCAEALLAAAAKQGVSIPVGVVLGDDLMGRLDELEAQGVRLDNMETGESYKTIKGRVASANAYFGAWPIAEALRQGAQIVITGRATDTGITLAPMIHEFGWGPADLDKLASGIIAGHIIECGAQATGGNYTDWWKVRSFANMGYPIVEVNSDGSFVVTKHPNTGGLVNLETVSEQLVYEMGDPREYLTPDVSADFTTARLAPDGPDRVRVSGIQGRPPPRTFKVSMSYSEGYKVSGSIILCGPEAIPKAEAFAQLFWDRLGGKLEETHTELVGYNSCHWHLSAPGDPNEVSLRLSARDRDKTRLEAFSKLLPSLILSGPPGVAATGGRPPVQEVIAYWPALLDRDLLQPVVELTTGNQTTTTTAAWPPIPQPSGAAPAAVASPEMPSLSGRKRGVVLSALAHGRSGDKGDTANIGIVARSDASYAWLREHLTASRVKQYFGALCKGEVIRHEVPNLRALNFLLQASLGGGGTVSLRIDPQGKTLSHALLAMEMKVDETVLATVSTNPSRR